MQMIAYIVNQLINLYVLVLFVTIILSWLINFNVINRHNKFVDAVWRACVSLTEPVLRPVRNMVPSLGGLDISPILVFVGLRAVQIGLNSYIFGPMNRNGL